MSQSSREWSISAETRTMTSSGVSRTMGSPATCPTSKFRVGATAANCRYATCEFAKAMITDRSRCDGTKMDVPATSKMKPGG